MFLVEAMVIHRTLRSTSSMRRNILSLILMVAVLSTCLVAQAQRPVGTYMPAKPTISPYLYLTKPNAGPLPNYQTFVEPIRNQTQVNNAQQLNIDTLQQTQTQQTQQIQLQATQQTQQDQALQKQQMKITPASVAPTGIGAGYNNMSHYYGGSGGAAGGSHARGGKGGGSTASARGAGS
jgi:hypothetical protein